MKAGDLVKMKYMAFWQKKHPRNQRVPYHETPVLVVEAAHNAVKVMTPEGEVKTDLAEYYEVVNEI